MIRLRTPEIITKLERSTFKERNVIRTKTRSEDDLVDKESLPHVHQSQSQVEEDEEQTGSVERERPGEDRMTGSALHITTTKSTRTETTRPTIMMYPAQPIHPVQPVQYPEVFTSAPQDIPVTEVVTVSHRHISRLLI